MRILICCATPRELKVVKEEIKKLNLKVKLPIEYLCTGIGNHLTIFTLTKFLEERKGESFFIVNIGVCGYVVSHEAGSLEEQDSDKIPIRQVEIRPTPLSEREQSIQGAIVEHLQIRKEHIIPIFLKVAPLRKVISSEVIVDDEAMIQYWKGEEVYVDMESYGIELVAQQFQYPRLILKVPVDRVGEETKHFDREEALRLLAEGVDYRKLMEGVLEYLHFKLKRALSFVYG